MRPAVAYRRQPDGEVVQVLAVEPVHVADLFEHAAQHLDGRVRGALDQEGDAARRHRVAGQHTRSQQRQHPQVDAADRREARGVPAAVDGAEHPLQRFEVLVPHPGAGRGELHADPAQAG